MLQPNICRILGKSIVLNILILYKKMETIKEKVDLLKITLYNQVFIKFAFIKFAR
jgi:hypothetical protein